MKLTRRQLNKIIAESLGVQHVSEIKGVPKVLNFRKMRKDLFALQKDIDNQALLDKVSAHREALNDKVQAGEGAFAKGRYREAVTLLKSIDEILDAPTPEKVKKVISKVPDTDPVVKPDPKPDPKPKDPDPKPWNPDPDPKVGWEYQNRECVWYARKKETTKEYKLGHASGKPVEEGGKFLKSIVKLNKAFPDLVKDCNPMIKPPKPKPSTKGKSWPDNAINLIKGTKLPADYPGTKEWKNAFVGACSSYVSTKGRSLTNFYAGMEPGTKFTGIYEWIALDQRQGGNGKDIAEALIDEVNEMAKEVSANITSLTTNPLNESLSRGSLYRRRYWGRY